MYTKMYFPTKKNEIDFKKHKKYKEICRQTHMKTISTKKKQLVNVFLLSFIKLE